MSYEDMNQLNTRILDHINTLCDQTQAAYASDQFQDWLRFCARFHTYSWRNQLLILWTCPDATLVKGRKDWESLGRAIKPEEEDRPIRIFAFRGYRRSEAKEESNTSKSEAADAEKPQLTHLSSGPRFSVVKVWDIAQTYGAELPAEPDWKSLERRTE